MQVRHATLEDIDTIMAIFDTARAFMRAHGNQEQWPVGKPSRATIEADVAAGNSYVVVDEDGIQGTFAFIFGIDPTYIEIEEGAWHSDASYAAVHRVASAGKKSGVTQAAFSYAAAYMPYLRCDTHEKNIPMQHAMEKFGFKRCGIIHIEDGSPRIAFDYLA